MLFCNFRAPEMRESYKTMSASLRCYNDQVAVKDTMGAI